MSATIDKKQYRGNTVYQIHVGKDEKYILSEEDYITYRFYEWDLDDETGLSERLQLINHKKAKSIAIRYISSKARCRSELVRKLEEEGYNSIVAENVAEELEAMGYVNDKIYILKYLFDRSKLKPMARRQIRMELMKKGLSASLIDEVFEEWEVDEQAVAEGLVKKKFGKYNMQDEKIRKKAWMFLQHRGFSSDIIRQVIGEYEDDTV